MAHTVKHGDLFELPLASGSRALCRIAFKSGYFRNVVLIGVRGITGAGDPKEQSKGPPVFSIYGSSASLRSGKWVFLQRTAQRQEDAELSKRLVAGDIWIENQCLGPAASGSHGVPEMDVYGDGVLARKVQHVLEG